eukprot:152026-Rhodomonas_salina.2
MLKSFCTTCDDLFQPTSSQFQLSQDLRERRRRAERSNKTLNARGKALVGQAAKALAAQDDSGAATSESLGFLLRNIKKGSTFNQYAAY